MLCQVAAEARAALPLLHCDIACRRSLRWGHLCTALGRACPSAELKRLIHDSLCTLLEKQDSQSFLAQSRNFPGISQFLQGLYPRASSTPYGYNSTNYEDKFHITFTGNSINPLSRAVSLSTFSETPACREYGVKFCYNFTEGASR